MVVCDVYEGWLRVFYVNFQFSVCKCKPRILNTFLKTKVKMFLSFLQKSKAILGGNNKSSKPQNEIHTHTVEESQEALTSQSCVTEELSKRSEELRETIYGNASAQFLQL